MTRLPYRLSGLLLPALLTLIACGEPSAREATRIVRFLEETPERLLDLQPGADAGFVDVGWRFAEPRDLEPWTVLRTDRPVLRDGGLVVPTGGLRLDGDVPPAGARSSELRVRVRGSLSSLRLYWAAAGERFDADRRLDIPLGTLRGGSPYRFDLAGSPGWAGSVGQLRLELKPRSVDPVLVGLELGRPGFDSEDVAVKVGEPWLVDLRHEVRPALLTPPGIPADRSLTVPEDGRLRAAVGFVGTPLEAVRFRALFVPDAAGEGSPREVEVGALELSPQDIGWRSFTADLTSLAGRTGTLRLESTSHAGFDLAEGVPVWAGPEVWGRPEEAVERPPNLVLISADTLRADHLEVYGYGRQTAPNLTRWARERGLTFLNTVSPAPWTLPSHTSMLTGLNPLTHGVNDPRTAPGSLDLLAEKLRRAGYHTIAYTGSSYLHPSFGLAQGFDRFHYWPITPGPDGQGEDLEGNMPLLLAELENLPEPFFLFFHTYEPHSPYQKRSPYYERYLAETGLEAEPEGRLHAAPWGAMGEEVGFIKREHFVRVVPKVGPVPLEEDGREAWIDAIYDSGISFLDEHLGRLFDALTARGLDDRTVTVFTSDHGEALGEAGLAGHFYLYDHNLMVPWIVSVPGRTGGETYEPQVRLEDLTPTVLDLLGQEVPPGLDGVSLGAAVDGERVAAPRDAWSYSATRNLGVSLRTANRLKLIYNNTAWSTVHGDRELYDLVADPGESDNRVADHAQTEAMTERVVERLRARSTGLVVTFENRSGEAARGGLHSRTLVQPHRVKGIEIPAPGVRWVDGKSARFAVPGGEDARLVFEAASPGDELHLRLEPSPGETSTGEPLEHTVVLGEDGSPPPWRPRPGLTVRFSFEPGAGSAGEVPELDPELREQLKALGYLN